MHYRFFLLSLLLLLPGFAFSSDVLIGSGSRAGVYYEVGRVVCRLLQRAADIDCEVLESAGSIENLNNVQVGALDLGLVQSDLQHHAANRSGPFQFVDAPYDRIRSLMSLYTEPFTLVVRRDAGIEQLADLKGRRVNIGNPGSGQRATMEVVMQAMGWTRDDFQLVTELPAAQQSLALCHNRIQALVYTVGHPNRSVAKAVELCNGEITQVSGPVIDELVASQPFYAKTTIPAGIYESQHVSVETFGVLATLVSSADIDDDLVYKVVKTLFENLERLQRSHRVFQELMPQRMIREGLTAPLHEGALRYYRERGWM